MKKILVLMVISSSVMASGGAREIYDYKLKDQPELNEKKVKLQKDVKTYLNESPGIEKEIKSIDKKFELDGKLSEILKELKGKK